MNPVQPIRGAVPSAAHMETQPSEKRKVKMKAKFLQVLLFVFAAGGLQSIAQTDDSGLTAAVTGAPTVENAACDWGGAQWVSGNDKNPYQLFRREFTLESVSAAARLHIYGEEFYQVYLNGRFVGDGPRRGTPPVYRTYQVGEWLKPGSNVLTIETFDSEGKSRLLCRLEGGGTGVVSDETWLNAPGKAWAETKLRSTAHSPVEIYDQREEPSGWRLPGFKAEGWKAAVKGKKPDANELESDPVPPVKRSFVAPEKIVRLAEAVELSPSDPYGNLALRLAYEPWEELSTARITSPEGFLDPARGPAVVDSGCQPTVPGFYQFIREHDQTPSVRCATVVLDFGRLINGNFYLDVEGDDGAQVDIGYSQVLIGGRVPTVLYGGDKAWEAKAGNKADRVMLRQGRQTWESFHWEQVRYVQLTFRNLSRPLKVHRFGLIERDPPLPLRGRFVCSDPVLTELWAASERTVRVTTQDLFMDNAIREKGPWTGECGNRSLMTCWITGGNLPLARYYCRQITRDPDKKRFLLHVLGPGECKEQHAFFHPLQTWYALDKYRLFATPAEYDEDMVLPAYRAYMSYLRGLLNDRGLIEKYPGVSWLDWAPGLWNRGTGAPQNLFFVLLLRGLADAESAAGNSQAEADCRRTADGIAAKVYELFWVPERGLYADALANGRPVTKQFSEHANALALLAGLGKDGRSEIILKNLAAVAPDLVQCDAPFTHFLAQACFDAGRDDLAVGYLRERFRRMLLLQSNPTLWEERSYMTSLRSGTWAWLPRYRSVAQSASAVPAFLLSTEVLGVKPLKPGFAEFQVAPKCGGLEWAEGVVPSPAGDIPVRWERQKDRFEISVTVPQGTQARIELPPGKSCLVDGKESKEAETGGRYVVTLGAGKHRCESIDIKNQDEKR